MTYAKRPANYTQLNVDIEDDLADALRAYADAEGVTRKQVVELALRRFLVSERAAKAETRMRAKK